jgi:palmitoyltransferase ZDHHC2/15/20
MKHRISFHLQRLCCALASLFPKVGVTLLLSWGVYTNWTICFTVLDGFTRYLFLGTGTILYSLSVLSYFCTVHYGAGSPLDIEEFVVKDVEMGTEAPPPQVLNNVTSKENGQMRFCNKCLCWKPDRTHHCRACKKCILKMDHHCPWFATCVGFKNHKFFVQFLIYATLFCWSCFASSLLAIVLFLKHDRLGSSAYLAVSWVLLLVLAGVMGLAVSVFSCYSVYLMLANKTTLESMETVRYRTSVAPSLFRFRAAPSSHSMGNIFDLGWKRNWCEVMGGHVWEWFIPTVPGNRGSGTWFPINEKLYRAAQLEADNEQQILERQRALSRPARTMNPGRPAHGRPTQPSNPYESYDTQPDHHDSPNVEQDLGASDDDQENVPLTTFTR